MFKNDLIDQSWLKLYENRMPVHFTGIFQADPYSLQAIFQAFGVIIKIVYVKVLAILSITLTFVSHTNL